jgi:hypothetical protein
MLLLPDFSKVTYAYCMGCIAAARGHRKTFGTSAPSGPHWSAGMSPKLSIFGVTKKRLSNATILSYRLLDLDFFLCFVIIERIVHVFFSFVFYGLDRSVLSVLWLWVRPVRLRELNDLE